MATRKRTTRKRTTTSRTTAATGTRKTSSTSAKPSKPAKPVPVPPVIPTGDRLWVLSVPYAERGVATVNGARWDAYLRQTVYIGRSLPMGLVPYASADYSWERYLEDDINGHVKPVAVSPVTFTPRVHQVEAATRIRQVAARGYRGFVEADNVGLGKTISVLEGVYGVARDRAATTMLVMCPKSVIPHWRRTIAALGDRGLRIVVINYDQAKKLLTVPETAAAAARTRTRNKRIAANGQPVVNWDIVVFDESHKCSNSSSQRSQAAARIARYAASAKTAPFVVWASATAGQNPAELGYLAPLFAQLTGASKSDLKDFGQWLANEGYAVTYNTRFEKWEWGKPLVDLTPRQLADFEAHKAHDLHRIHALLFTGPDAPAIRRQPSDIAGWPEIQRIPHPVELDAEARRLYQQAWTEFRRDMKLFAKGRDPKGGEAARLRFRQKASLIRVPGTVDLVTDLLDNGHQVAVSVEFLETLDALRTQLAELKVSVAEFSGRNTTMRESERLRFQRGEASVIIFTVTEGISLHANEMLPDATRATAAQRSMLVHDPRYSGIDAVQIEGRCHRDGENANAFYLYAEDTVEERIVQTSIGRIATMQTMVGDDTTNIKLLESMLDDAALDDLLTSPDATATPVAPLLTSLAVSGASSPGTRGARKVGGAAGSVGATGRPDHVPSRRTNTKRSDATLDAALAEGRQAKPTGAVKPAGPSLEQRLRER